jgi:hypothetical protein
MVAFELAVAPIWSAPGPKEKAVPPNYWPTEVGTTWVYDMNNGEGEQVIRIASVEEKDGTTVVDMQQRGTTKWLPAERLVISGRGIQKTEFDGYAIDPYYKLKFPIKIGDSWDYEYPFQVGLTGVKGTVTIVGEEEVRVAAGKFKAVKVEQQIKEQNGKPLRSPITVTSWWAEGVGRVKTTDSFGGVLALKSFRQGVK